MSALLPILRDLIASEGPISVARYMDIALQHPQHGYYRRHDPLGMQGDFITAPEISQIFGELIGLWCAEAWRGMGKPQSFILLELGPGRGTLMQDALRATAKIAGFHQALKLWLLESNETLRQAQRDKLAAHDPVHVTDLAQVPPLPLIVVANEFFDALPIQQFMQTKEGWRERLVGLVGDGIGFADEALLPQEATVAITEISPLSLSFMRQIALHVAQHGGAGLIVDYGYAAPLGSSTLQAVRRHERADLFADPGEADLTALVDFAALAATIARQGLQVAGPVGQGAFLQAMGIDLRAAQLKHKATPQQAAALDSGVTRLTEAAQMGTLFKVLGFVRNAGEELAGFP